MTRIISVHVYHYIFHSLPFLFDYWEEVNPEQTPMWQPPAFAAVKQNPAGICLGKLALTRTPDPVGPTRRGSDPNQPMYESKERFSRGNRSVTRPLSEVLWCILFDGMTCFKDFVWNAYGNNKLVHCVCRTIVKEMDLHSAFIAVPHTQGAQVRNTDHTVLPANYIVPAFTS